ncbi:MAG: hypothetical protein U9O87_03865 [Verrucomicrobiota bacterium]|nr:hypothetical protein [Verrucomicrobiota bacterium]
MGFIKFVIIIAICIGVYFGYKQMSLIKVQTKELNRLRGLYSNQKWEEITKGYETFWKKYPEQKGVDKKNVSNAYQFIASDLHIKAISGDKSKYIESAQTYEKATEFGKLNEASLIDQCDNYLTLKKYDKAKEIIKEAKDRSDINERRFKTYQMRIKRKF